MQPPKFEVKYPCPKCGKTTTAVTDFGKPAKHVCAECRDATQRGEKCHGCGSRKGTLYWNYECFEYDHYNIVEEYYFHKHCLAEYEQDNREEWP